MPKRKYPMTLIEKRAKRLVDNRRYYHELHPEQAGTLSGQYCNPEWRRHRIRIIVLHDFTCDLCGTVGDIDEDLFTVRRKVFNAEETRLIWDVPAEEFEVVCRECGNKTKKENYER